MAIRSHHLPLLVLGLFLGLLLSSCAAPPRSAPRGSATSHPGEASPVDAAPASPPTTAAAVEVPVAPAETAEEPAPPTSSEEVVPESAPQPSAAQPPLADEAVAEPAEAELDEPAEPAIFDEIVETVGAWRRAWSNQRVVEYLSFYSSRYDPPGGRSRAAWEAERHERLRAPEFIELEIGPITVRGVGTTWAEATFVQAYRSDRFSDRVRKTLALKLEDDGWRIVDERSEPAP